jgi:hypothetical protein
MSFKNYHSNPVTRQAHEIQKGNVITSLAFGDFETVIANDKNGGRKLVTKL